MLPAQEVVGTSKHTFDYISWDCPLTHSAGRKTEWSVEGITREWNTLFGKRQRCIQTCLRQPYNFCGNNRNAGYSLHVHKHHKQQRGGLAIRDGLTLATTVAPRPLTESNNLPQRDSKGPHVCGGAKLSLRNRLKSHPSQRQTPGHRLHIHPFLMPVVTQTKVGDQHLLWSLHEDIVAGEVAMHHTETAQIFLQS